MRSHRTAAAACLFALLLVPAAARAVTISPDQGAWCWFADPRAVTYNGHPVFGWVDGFGNIMVGDDTGRQAVLHARLEQDDHDNPAFYIRKDGRLTAFWSAHSGPELYYRTTTGTNITDWGPVKTMPANPPGPRSGEHTYPNPVRAGDTLYLFWSGTAATATYATSPDDGATWTDARSLFDPAAANFVRYIKYSADGEDIHMAWNLGHPRDNVSGIHHAIIRGGVIYGQDGTQIGELGVPLDPDAGDLVYDADTDGGAWIHDLTVVNGEPVIVYATFPTVEDHTYRYARWTAGVWRDERITMAGPSFNETLFEAQYSGGISLNHGNGTVVYLSRMVGGEFEVERWIRRPEGWERQPITHGSSVPNVRPYYVAGGLAWMRGEYPGFRRFETALEWLPPGTAWVPPTERAPEPTSEPVPAPSEPPATKVANPVPRPAAPQRRCAFRGWTIRRHGRVSCAQAQRALRRYTRSWHSPGAWRCRSGGRVVCRKPQVRVRVSVARGARFGRYRASPHLALQRADAHDRQPRLADGLVYPAALEQRQPDVMIYG